MSDTLDGVKASIGPMRDLLARHGYFARGKTVRCPSLDHDDRNPSASIFTAYDGDERVHCFSCGFDEDTIGVAAALGERIPDWTTGRSSNRQTSIPRPDFRVTALGRLLKGRPQWPFEWQVAKLLAELEPRDARQEVLQAWRFLSARGDVDLILRTAYLIRGVAILNFCTSGSIERPGAITHAVRRLVNGRA